MGVDNVLVQAGAASRNGVSLGSGSNKTLTPEDAEAILRECPSVAGLAPIVYARLQVVRGNRNWVPASLFGTTPGFLQVRDWDDLAEGEAFTDTDVRDTALVCLLGRTPGARALRRRRDAGRPGGRRAGRAAEGPRRAPAQGGRHHRRGPGRHPAGAPGRP
jgi:hypothetical protein